VGVVNLAVLECVLRATTKKVVNFFEKGAPPDKILATPMVNKLSRQQWRV